MQLIDLIHLVVYSIMIYCSVLWLSVFLKNRKKMLYNPEPKRFPSITFLVPAYNEEKNIEKCLRSLLNLSYPKGKLKIIVIDDGSTDRTPEIVKKFKGVKLVKQENRGKAAALNNGLKYVKTELVACMDADSFPEKGYIIKMIGYLEKRNVAAVTPAMKVLKPKTIIQKIQWVEYLWSIFLRKIFNFFDCQYVIPGPGSIYRTSVLKKLGGFEEGNITEDTEIALRIIDKGYRIENSINAYVYTEAPKTFKGLYKQRLRWYRGYIQNVIKYSKMVFNPKYGNLGIFLLPINFVWMFIMGFLLLSSLFTSISNLLQHFVNWSYIRFGIIKPEIRIDIFLIDFYTYFSLIFLVLSLLTIWLSVVFSGEKVKLKKRFTFYLSYVLIYPPLTSIFWLSAIIYEVLRVKRRW